MAHQVIQPTRGKINECIVGDLPHIIVIGGEMVPQYHVKEFRIYEDICKSYFTGQLVIETLLNTSTKFVYPTAEVFLDFECPRTDGGPTRKYRERFRIYSYDSKEIGAGADGRVEHTIALIGQEYYNDKHNVVTRSYKNITGIAAATIIHKEFMESNGSLLPFSSMGMIGLERHPHQVMNKKPIKAIHDILDRCVFGQYKTCAPLYFRRKQGYVMAPLQHQLEHGPLTQTFTHYIGEGNDLKSVFEGYDLIINFKPIAPPGEASPGVRAGEISGMRKAQSFVDLQSGNIRLTNANINTILNLPFMNNIPGIKGKVREMLAEAQKGNTGAFNMFSIIDELLQKRSVDKNGPGGWQTSQDALITALTYSTKYWVTVPGQTGLNVTAGDRITVTFPVNNIQTTKTLFVPRLIHEFRVTQGNQRGGMHINGKTEIYGVDWGA